MNDQKNFIIVILLSVAILFGFQYFFSTRPINAMLITISFDVTGLSPGQRQVRRIGKINGILTSLVLAASITAITIFFGWRETVLPSAMNTILTRKTISWKSGRPGLRTRVPVQGTMISQLLHTLFTGSQIFTSRNA